MKAIIILLCGTKYKPLLNINITQIFQIRRPSNYIVQLSADHDLSETINYEKKYYSNCDNTFEIMFQLIFVISERENIANT